MHAVYVRVHAVFMLMFVLLFMLLLTLSVFVRVDAVHVPVPVRADGIRAALW